MAEKFILGIVDYAILGTVLALFAATGLYFRVSGGGQKTNEEYLFAGKDMPIFPVSFSLMATFLSTATVMGLPAETYAFGTNMAFLSIGNLVGPIIASIVFLPIYFSTGVLTAYEYLEKRFGVTTRRILSGIFLFQYTFFSGIVLYAPALALSSVTNLSLWTSVISVGVICTFYCTMGGMKAILWTDVFQAFLMYTCLLSVIIKGCIDLGGFGNIFNIAYEGGRILLPTFEIDFSERYTMWSVLLQGFILSLQTYGSCQVQVQRLLTLRNLKRSKTACIISAPMATVFQLLSCFCGLILYVSFKSCDPMTSQSISIYSMDQLMPYYIISEMGKYPGLSGLCIAGIFSASLSTVSSAVNSLATVTYEDIICSLWPSLSGSVCITKVACLFYGVTIILISYFVKAMGNLMKSSFLALGMVAGPSLAVYILAAFTTTANEMGTNIGAVAGFVFAGCMIFIPNERYYPVLSVGGNCTDSLVTILNFTTPINASYLPTNSTEPAAVLSTAETFPVDNFPVSYMWVTPLSLLASVIVGYIGSWIVSSLKGSTKTVPPELLSPVNLWFHQTVKKDKKKSDVYDVSDDVVISRF